MQLLFPVPSNCRRTFNSHFCLDRATVNWMNKFQSEQRATAPPAGCYFTRQVPLFLCDWTCSASLTSNLACLCPAVERCAETLALTGPNTCRKKPHRRPSLAEDGRTFVTLLTQKNDGRGANWGSAPSAANRRSHTGHWAVGGGAVDIQRSKVETSALPLLLRCVRTTRGAASLKLGLAAAFLRKTTWRITHGSYVKRMCGRQKLHHYCDCVTIWKKVPL